MFKGPEGDTSARSPVSLVSTTPFVLIVAPRVPAKTVPELVAYAKANPGKLNFGAPAGATPLLVGELFKMQAGIHTTIPYRGAATTMNDMLSGQIDMAVEPTSVTLAHVAEAHPAAGGHQRHAQFRTAGVADNGRKRPARGGRAVVDRRSARRNAGRDRRQAQPRDQ